MRLEFLLAAYCLLTGQLAAWDTTPHQQITRAALDTLPAPLLTRFPDLDTLVEVYSLYPDRYLEMELFGFVRKGAGPKDPAEIRRYCVRPDGIGLHGLTADRDSDTASLLYLLERIVSMWIEGKDDEAARYTGVLSHFVADSSSPPHAVTAEELKELVPGSSEQRGIRMHGQLERSIPNFRLRPREPRRLDTGLVAIADVMYQQCAAARQDNQKQLPSLVTALTSPTNEGAIDKVRLRMGRRSAEILADGLYSLFSLMENSH